MTVLTDLPVNVGCNGAAGSSSGGVCTVLTDLPVNVGCNGAAGSSSGGVCTVLVALTTSTADTPAFAVSPTIQ